MNKARILAQLAQLLAGEIPVRPEWGSLLYVAGEELIVTQLMSRLEPVRDALPMEVRAYLSETQKRSMARNARLRETLSHTLAALNAVGIEPVLLKGAALWATAAGSHDRLIRDIDILVRPQEMQGAVDALASAGFAVLADERATSVHNVVVMGRDSDVGSVDIHQHAPARLTYAPHDEVHAHAHRVEIAGGRALAPSPEAQILVTAIHDQIHDAQFWRGGFNLRHLLDIAALTRQGVDWDALMSMCRTRTERIAVGAELCAARAIAGAEIPPSVLKPWARLHYWRQQAQVSWPALTGVIERVRAIRAIVSSFLRDGRLLTGMRSALPAS